MTSYRKQLNRFLADYRHARTSYQEEKSRLRAARETLQAACQAQILGQQAAEAIQASVHNQIASVVTRCLQTVFGDQAYEFRINFIQRRGRTEAELVFVRDDQEIDPIASSGGGVVDIAAFALRLACLLLMRPPRRRVLIADEPFRFVSADYIPAVRRLLLSLAQDLGIQFILVTHIAGLKCGKVINLGDDSDG